MMKYTKEQIEQAIIEWQKRLRLQHWTLKITYGDLKNENNLAEVQTICTRYFATIRIGLDLLEEDPKEVSMAIAHELLHLHTDHLDHDINEMSRGCSNDLKDAINIVMYNGIERTTDALAIAISEMMPIPESLKNWQSGKMVFNNE